MKNLKLILISVLLNTFAILFVTSQIKVVDDGKVGIGDDTPEEKLDVEGHIELNGNYIYDVTAIYGHKVNDYMLRDHDNGNVTLSALGTDLYVGYRRTYNVRFYSGNTSGTGTERMRLKYNGYFGIGTTDPAYPFEVRKSQSSWLARFYNTSNGARMYLSNNGGYGAYINPGNNSSSSKYALQVTDGVSSSAPFLYINGVGNTGIGRIPDPNIKLDVDGTLRVNTTVYTSDERFKEDISEYQGNLENIKKLKPVSYKLKKYKKTGIDEITNLIDESTSIIGDTIDFAEKPKDEINIFEEEIYNRNRIGFLAQDIQEVFPEIVYSDSQGILSIDYISLIPVLVAALKEQQAKIEQLEALMKENVMVIK